MGELSNSHKDTYSNVWRVDPLRKGFTVKNGGQRDNVPSQHEWATIREDVGTEMYFSASGYNQKRIKLQYILFTEFSALTTWPYSYFDSLLNMNGWWDPDCKKEGANNLILTI